MTNPVSQRAREAAADYVALTASEGMRVLGAGSGIRIGQLDDHPAAQAFAKFEREVLEGAASIAFDYMHQIKNSDEQCGYTAYADVAEQIGHSIQGVPKP